MASSPFAPSTAKPGQGNIVLSLLPPNTPVLRDVSYQYPLKLIAPSPLLARKNTASENDKLVFAEHEAITVHTVFV